MAAGTYNLQFASNTYDLSRGVQLDNILLTGTAVTTPGVPEDGSTLAMGTMATLLLFVCRRSRNRGMSGLDS